MHNTLATTTPNDEPSPDDEGQRTYHVREAVALFPSEDQLETAILALEESGIDRARISVLGYLPSKDDAGTARNWMRHLVDVDAAPRGAPKGRSAMAEAETAVVALPGFGGAMFGLIAVMASGGALGLAVASAILAGAVGSGAGYLLARSISEHHTEEVVTQLEAGGLVLWIALHDDDEKILNLLKKAGGQKAHVTERDAHWGPADIPFSKGQPDPFL